MPDTMPSERVQRRIDRLLDQAEEAADARDWPVVLECVDSTLALDSENEDAIAFKEMAEAGLRRIGGDPERSAAVPPRSGSPISSSSDVPNSFANGRYEVKSLLGEGGKKKVYLAHDTTLERDVAFGLIKAEGLDADSRQRITREAQAMARLGDHPNLMPIFDLGEDNGQPYMVQPLMVGGDVEALIEEADEKRLPLDVAIRISSEICHGLEFAHGEGIIHRDLKPGNVWLTDTSAGSPTASGSATGQSTVRIGDFGLALSIDRSRLTQEKMMVGTVSYMPPEQATGGEITARADLYSLGAMFYEMVTGRPPFMGDDDIAIIGQHINTPPVAPQWHRPEIPAPLDALIMRLLAKNPAERPESAADVSAAIGAIDISTAPSSQPYSGGRGGQLGEASGSLDSMAGGVFVGRHRETDQLKAMLESALSGRGGMATLVGEPGIGKTRTSQELETYAGLRNAQVLWGRCYEGGGAPPYWPWVQAIRSYVASHEPDQVRSQMGSTASVISDIVDDIKTSLPDVQPPTQLDDPESARFRLFDSVATFLKNAGQAQPIVLVLDDLHWADRPSLLLLEFVARELASSRVMIVGTYRDMELNRRHPLTLTLGDLTRERLFERVLLRGLTREDVARFIEIAAGVVPPRGLTDAVHTQTEGNPLFVTETVRLLIQEGDLSSDGGSEGADGTRSDSSWNIRIPEGVREVIGRRLDRLSERCNDVFTIASVIGRRFTLDQLRAVAEDITEGQLLDVIDEGLAARVIKELPREIGLYQFTHAVVEETLASELSLTRRVRIHARVAAALEEMYGDTSGDHSEELVKHFEQAQTVLGPERVAYYAQIAGEAAQSALGYDEAARYYELALDALGDDGDADQIATLHRDVAIAHSALRNVESALKHIEISFRHFVDTDQADLAASVATIQFVSGAGQSAMLPYLRTALELVDASSEQRPLVMSLLGRSESMYADSYEIGKPLLINALKFARDRQDQLLEMQVLGDISISAFYGLDQEVAKSSILEMMALGESVDDPLAMPQAHRGFAFQQSEKGDKAGALKSLDDAIEAARRSGDRQRLGTNFAIKAFFYGAYGEWDNLESAANEALGQVPNDTRVTGLLLLVDAMRGDYSRLAEHRSLLLETQEEEWGLAWQFHLAALYTRRPEDRDVLDTLPAASIGGVHRSASLRVMELTHDAATVFLDRDRAQAGVLIPALSAIPEFALTGSRSAWPDGHALAGLLSLLCDRPDDAVSYLEVSLNYSRTRLFTPWLAMGCEALAEALLTRNAEGDAERATELQDEAIGIASELGMNPMLERLLAQRDVLSE